MSSSTKPATSPAFAEASSVQHWAVLAAIVAIGIGMRLTFYSGFYGSDEVTYLAAAVNVLNGDWTPSTYIGAIRYGFQLPMAAFMAVFGQSEQIANLWPLLCSVAEIALVVVFGRRFFGLKAGALAGLILAVLPLHVHYAGRIMADAPLALFITASFLLFWRGQQTNTRALFFFAGLAAGCVFWIKEVTTFYLAVFLTYPLIFRCWNWRWMWMLAGFALVFGANLIFFWLLAGDPLYVFRIVSSGVTSYANSTGRFASASTHSAPIYYFEYLFAKVYHTWLLGLFALAGMFAALAASRRETAFNNITSEQNGNVLIWWGGGLILLFTFFPLSLSPLKLISKQVNYMLVFVAPLALLAGVFLSRLKPALLSIVLTSLLVPSILLSGLEKAVVHQFTAVSKATVGLAKAHPDVSVYGSTGAIRAATFDALIQPEAQAVTVHSLDELLTGGARLPQAQAYAVLDIEVAKWARESVRTRTDIPHCWRPDDHLLKLAPAFLRNFGHSIDVVSAWLPEAIGAALAQQLHKTVTLPAHFTYVMPSAKGNALCPGDAMQN